MVVSATTEQENCLSGTSSLIKVAVELLHLNRICSCWLAHCSVCACGERSHAPECADKLVKWGVVPGGTLTLYVVVFLPSHIIIFPTLFNS